jgi:hypothetical protein
MSSLGALEAAAAYGLLGQVAVLKGDAGEGQG